MKSVGLDVGYGFVKVTDDNIGYSFPSVVGDSSINPLSLDVKMNRSPIDNMRLSYKGKTYNIGKSAIKHSNYLYRDLSVSRSYGNNFEIMFLAALSLMCNKPENEVCVVTGLPPQHMHMAEDINLRLRGQHNISVFKDNRFQDVKITIHDIDIVPQPLGTFWSQYLIQDNNDQNTADGMRVGVIDIGFGTTDLAIIEDGEYIHEKSRTIPIGMSSTYKETSDEIFRRFGINKEMHSLDQIVIKKTIKLANEEKDISDILAASYDKIAQNIIVEINSQWNHKELDQILVTGGGGHEMSKHLLAYFPQAVLVNEPFTANCRGYLAWSRYKDSI